MKIAVIPDIHGELGALQALLKAMGPAGPKLTIVQLGDFIDRGPESRGCVELLMRLQKKAPKHFIVLKGNHEDMLVKSDKSRDALVTWIGNGGPQTMTSYKGDFEALCRGDGAHRAWMTELPLTWECEGVLFCHAGLSWKNAKKMAEEGLLWDRPPLTRGDFKAVVCGHSPTVSRHVEHKDGVFRCDLGLGHKPLKDLEYLELDLGSAELKWAVKKV